MSSPGSDQFGAGRSGAQEEPIGVVLTDVEGLVLDADEHAATLLGDSAANLKNVNLADLVQLANAEAPALLPLDELKLRYTVSWRVRPVRAGEDGPLLILRGAPLTGESYAFTLRTALSPPSIDESTFEAGNMIRLLIDPVIGSIVEANAAACDFYGRPHEQLTRMRIQDLISDQVEDLDQQLAAMAASKAATTVESCNFAAGGAIRRVEAHVSPIVIGGRRLLFAEVHDITDRFAAEESLRESEELFRAIASNLPGVVYSIIEFAGERRRMLLYLGAGLDALIGAEGAAAVARDPDELTRRIHDDDRKLVRARTREAVEQGTPLDCDYRLRRDDGSYVWVRSLGRAIAMDGDVLWQGIIVPSAQPPRKEAEERYRELALGRERLLQELNHRVKNNLAGLLALLDLIQAESMTTTEFADSFRRRINAMIATHDILSQVGWRAVDLQYLVNTLVTEFERGYQVKLQLLTSGPPLSIPPAQAGPLALIIQELLTNWHKHAETTRAPAGAELVWEILDESADANRARLIWQEFGSERIRQPERFGLGLNLISGFARYELGGEARFTFAPPGLRVEIDCTFEA